MEGILLGLGFIGIALAVLTPLAKSGTGLTLVSLAVYFWFIGIETWLPVILFTAGLLLIVFEIFVPEFGLSGIVGMVLLVSGLYLTIGDITQTVRDLSLSVVITSGVVFYLVKNGYSLTNVNKLILQTNLQGLTSKSESKESRTAVSAGLEGLALTPLRPSGKASFDNEGHVYDVLSIDGHIAQDTPVIIDKVTGTKITVRKK
ncbi:putative membrane-bound ClpP-class protease [Alkalibacterium sp. AK22]|uniref:NfeD family protein n=1 Tax=Alkalibacterium sp. AK22 TaxID=1229520 RepID=UPI0004524BF5|nr:hydrolase [Alkalibacterium sp. AK22]EXJ23521.1 putative membrane-bound ClpP-class protease [Alkalibacterium sp. AK22]